MPVSTKSSTPKTIAAIDIGTNSIHLLIADMDADGTMRLRDSDKVQTRLGRSLNKDGNLTQEGFERTLETLAHMHEIITPYKAQVRAVATFAVREARNHKLLIKEIQSRTGIMVEVIDGIEEARLVFLGIRYGLALDGIPCLAIDIGGGSTEIIIAQDDDIQFVSSFKLGAVTLSEKYFGKMGYSSSAIKELKTHVKSRLAPIPHETENCVFKQAIASSGTAKALAFMHAGLFRQNNINDANGYILPAKDLYEMTDLLQLKITPAKIREISGLDSSRADIILAGAIILSEVCRSFQIKELTISTFGLREGLVADTYYRINDKGLQNFPDIQWNSILSFGKRLRIDQPHAYQVMKLATRIFELLSSKLRYEDNDDDIYYDLKLLRASAYLREAGKFLSAPQYHRHSQYLISNSRLPGFTESERIMMGLIARFHRKGVPHAEHPECSELSPKDLRRLCYLSGILRLSAALDRTRQNRVKNVEINSDSNGTLIIELIHDLTTIPDVELHKAHIELAALEKTLGTKLQIKLRGA